MIHGRSRLVATYVAAVAVLLAGVFVFAKDRRDRHDPFAAADRVRTAATMPFAVSLSVPGTGRMQLGSTEAVALAAYSEHAVERIDLYDGGTLVASARPDGPGSVIVRYPALQLGARLLSARAVDEAGEVAISTPVRVFVSNARGRGKIGVPVPLLEGETGQQLADRLGVRADRIFAAPTPNDLPQAVPPARKIPAGRTVFVSTRIDPAAKPPADLRIVAPRRIDRDKTLGLHATGDACTITLNADRRAGDVTYLEGTTSGWLEIGSKPAGGKLVLDQVTPGTHVFAVRPKNGDAGRQSAPVTATAPNICGQGLGWTGDARIVDGQLLLDEPPGGIVYLYLRVDDQPARRVPWAQNLGVPGTASTDVSDQLPRLVGRRLDLEVWKGGEFPQQIAAGHLEPGSGQTIQDVVGEPNLLTVAFSDGTTGQKDLGHDDGTVELTWVSESSRVTSVVWQVTAQDPGARNLSLTPDGLIATGVSSNSASGDARATGTFSIDTAKIPGHEEVTNPSKKAPASGGGVVLATSPVDTATVGKLDAATYASKPPKAPKDASILLQGYVSPPGAGEPIFVRVLALPDQTGITAVSSASRIVLPAIEKGTLDDPVELKITQIDVDLGRAPNPALVSCARVTVPWDDAVDQAADSWDFSVFPPKHVAGPPPADYGANAAFVRAFYPHSGTYCPGDWPPADDCDSIFCDVIDGLVSIGEAIVEVVTQLYTLVSYAYNGIIDTVVKVVAQGPLCALIGAADKTAGDGCETVVGAATRAAIGAVLATVGLPPSLPSVEALEAMADGELDALAVELMKQAGVPCDSLAQDPSIVSAAASAAEKAGADAAYVKAAGNPCQAVARYLIDQVEGQAKQAASDSVAQTTGLPSLAGTTASMVPEPKGVTQPWTLTITATPTRKTADVSNLSCRIAVKQVGGPMVWTSELHSWLHPDGQGHLRGVATFTPRVGADKLSNVTATLRIRPYVSSCDFPTKAVVGSVKPYAPR